MTDRLVDATLELAYLGGVLSSSGGELALHPVPADAMAVGAHRVLLEALLAVQHRGEVVNHLSARVELERRGRLALVGDELLVRLGSVFDPDQGAVASRLRELAALRRARDAGRRAAALAEEGKLTEARAAMQAAALDAGAVDDDPVLTYRDALHETMEAWHDISVGKGEGLDLGMHSTVDEAIRPLPSEGDVVIVAARPGVGKSSLVDKALLAMALRGVTVGKVSVEDGAKDFGAKSLGALARVNTSKFWQRPTEAKSKGPSQADWNAITAAGHRHTDIPIRFARIRSNRLDGVVSRMSMMAHGHSCKVIAVDYVQRIRGGQGKDTREQINDVIGTLVATARQLGVVLLLVSQLKRPDGGSPFKEPSEIDLKESGALEEVAQGLVLLWRKTDNPADPGYGLVFGKVAKVKRGESGQRFTLGRDRESGALVELHGWGDG